MSAPQPTSKNRTSLKIHLAYRFLLALNTLNMKRSAFDHTQNHKRSHRVKIAAYASMASVVGPRRAWSRAILWKIRNQGVLTRNKKRVHHITTSLRLHRHHARPTRRRNPNREHVNPFGNSGLEVKLRKLVPGAETMDPCGLLDETADYIKHLATQVEVMKTLVDLYSTI
ncbi:unnamed protein product [Lactuca virosa]|uniref:IBH1-like N-terminal domain-containing protein n=1 Tax=Lactuca virosa TaxID=75947 RepID=A0AAU9PAK4_9ASTR|nr:unnamed protein product [Lactuca virosa]